MYHHDPISSPCPLPLPDATLYPNYPSQLAQPLIAAPSLHESDDFPRYDSYADAYPPPCAQQLPPQLHIQTDLCTRYPASASGSLTVSTPFLTPDSHSALSDQQPEYAFDLQDTTQRGHNHLSYLLQDPPAHPLWSPADGFRHPSSDSEERLDVSTSPWQSSYKVTQGSPSYSQAHSDREQVQVPSYPYPATHVPQTLSQGVYGHGIPFPSHDIHLSSHQPMRFDQNTNPTQLSPNASQPSPVFDSPLREPIQQPFTDKSREPKCNVSQLERGFSFVQHVDARNEQAPPNSPSVVYSERDQASWPSASPPDYFPAYRTQDHDSPQPQPGIIESQRSPSQLSPPAPPLLCSMETQFHAIPLREDRTSIVQPPRLLEEREEVPEPIPRLSQPCRSSRAVSASSSSPCSTVPLMVSPQACGKPSPGRHRTPEQDESLSQVPIVPSQSHLALHSRKDQLNAQQTFHTFHSYPPHYRADQPIPSSSDSRIQYHDGLTGRGIPPIPVFGLYGSYPLSRDPCDQALPGPTCAPATSSSVMRLVLTSPFKRPQMQVQPPPPPPPPVAPMLPARKPRMACYFCRKRKIACGPGPPAVQSPRATQGGKDKSSSPCDDDGPCNQCARRGLECERPTESKRGVRKGKGRGRDEGDGQEHTVGLVTRPEGPEVANASSCSASQHPTLSLAPRSGQGSLLSGGSVDSEDEKIEVKDEDDDGVGEEEEQEGEEQHRGVAVVNVNTPSPPLCVPFAVTMDSQQ